MTDPTLPPVRALEERLAGIERSIAELTDARLQHNEIIASIREVISLPEGAVRDAALQELNRRYG